jgi:hydrogenase nickel incorporation protein HypA/HybF
MHERTLMRDVLARIEQLANEERAVRVTRVDVRLGALSHFTPEHFREHFEDASRGGVADGALVVATLSPDVADPHAADVIVESVEVEV